MDRRLGSSTKWVSWWVGDVELQWASDIEDRVGPTAVRQRGESLREGETERQEFKRVS